MPVSGEREKTVVVHYAELALKGQNRAKYVGALIKNLKAALSDLDPVNVWGVQGRILVDVPAQKLEIACSRIQKIFGVAWFAEASTTSTAYPAILSASLSKLEDNHKPATSFRLEARRSDKSLPFKSSELVIRLGSDISNQLGMKVNLDHPDVNLRIDITSEAAIIYSEKRRGPGGLPIGVGGKVIHLMSGGIDSPVAAWLLMKRGCVLSYLHFYPFASAEGVVSSKIPRLVSKLREYGGADSVLLAPFSQYELATLSLGERSDAVLFRYFTRLVATRLAETLGCSAIGTGDSIGQVASQTSENLAAMDYGSRLPVFRPLLTYDKQEIIDRAKAIGTYEIALEDYKDCCSLLSSHPRTRISARSIIESAEKAELHRVADKVARMVTLLRLRPNGSAFITPLLSRLVNDTPDGSQNP